MAAVSLQKITCTLLWLDLLGFRDYDGALFVHGVTPCSTYEGWNFNSGNYLFTTDTK